MIIMFTKPCVIWLMLLFQQTWKVSIYSQQSLHPGCSRSECFFLIPHFLLLSCDFAMHQSGPSHSLIHWVWTWLSDFCFWGLWKFKILLQVLVWPFRVLRPTMRRACTSDPHFLWPGLQRDLWGKPETYLHSGTKQGSPTSLQEGDPTLTNANCCWSWSSNPLVTWCEEPTHWKRSWCWERLRAGAEGGGRGWDGWVASLTRWTWVWVDSGSWWWTGRPGMLRFMGSQRVGHDWVTELRNS